MSTTTYSAKCPNSDLFYFPVVEPVTTVLLSRPEAQGEPSTPFTLLWTQPSSRGWNEPGMLVGP
jgi:hypothetical protein